jgi:2,4'-dihydroxyacetophenone dioxygenase
MDLHEALVHVDESKVPWVDLRNGTAIRVPHVDVEQDFFILNSRLEPSYRSGRHRHSGSVFVLTLRGAWRYLEHDDVMRPGSYLYEPAGSIHTLQVLEDNQEPTEFWAVVHGALEYLDELDNPIGTLDASAASALYSQARELATSAAGPSFAFMGRSQ